MIKLSNKKEVNAVRSTKDNVRTKSNPAKSNQATESQKKRVIAENRSFEEMIEDMPDQIQKSEFFQHPDQIIQFYKSLEKKLCSLSNILDKLKDFYINQDSWQKEKFNYKKMLDAALEDIIGFFDGKNAKKTFLIKYISTLVFEFLDETSRSFLYLYDFAKVDNRILEILRKQYVIADLIVQIKKLTKLFTIFIEKNKTATKIDRSRNNNRIKGELNKHLPKISQLHNSDGIFEISKSIYIHFFLPNFIDKAQKGPDELSAFMSFSSEFSKMFGTASEYPFSKDLSEFFIYECYMIKCIEELFYKHKKIAYINSLMLDYFNKRENKFNLANIQIQKKVFHSTDLPNYGFE